MHTPVQASTRDHLDGTAARPPIILASASVARLGLLRRAGVEVEVRPSALDEAHIKHQGRLEGRDAGEVALRLAEAKALSRVAPGALVIGADQILVLDGHWFDKPADLAEARTHLQALRGRTHVLHTAVCLCREGAVVWRHVARPRLTMRSVSDAALDAYLTRDGSQVLDSVGAYRLEGPGMQLFAAIEGEYAAILGLPLLDLLEALRAHGALPA